MESATNRLAMDTATHPHTAETGPPFLYAIDKKPACSIQTLINQPTLFDWNTMYQLLPVLIVDASTGMHKNLTK